MHAPIQALMDDVMPLEGEQRPPESPRRVKRITARELSPAEAEAMQAEPAPIAGDSPVPEVAIPVPMDESAAPPVVDPTEFSERHRKRAHHHLYRWTQVFTLLSFLAAAASLALGMFESDEFDGALAKGIAAAGMMLAAVAIHLARRTSLSGRMHGYAVAAMCMSAIVLAANLVGVSVRDSEEGGPQQTVKTHRR